MKVGIIGLGMLGNAVALRLLDSGIKVNVFNRTSNKTKKAIERGATALASPREVAQNSQLVIVAVKDAKAVEEVSFGKGGIIKGNHEGLIVADMSTISPTESKKITQEFLGESILKLDIPVMGGPNAAIIGGLVMMVSGDKESFERCRQVFGKIADRVFYLGDSGVAHSVKLAMNLQIAMLALALSEGITLVRSSNVDPRVFLEILNSTYFKTGMSEKKAFKMVDGKYDPTFTLSNLKKDISTMTRTARELGIELPMIKKAEEVYEEAVQKGLGDVDYTGIIEHIKRINGK